MARNFGNSPTANFDHASLISNTDPRPVSVAFWVNVASNTINCPFSNNNSDNSAFATIFRSSGANTQQTLYSGGNAANSTAFSPILNTWFHYGLTWDASGNVAFYLNGAANGTASSISVGGTTTAGATIGSLKQAGTGSYDIDGSLAEFSVWDVILGADDFATLAKGISALAVRPEALRSYVPLINDNAGDASDIIDGTSWTEGGTIGVSEHPRIMRPSRPRLIVPPAAAPAGGDLLLRMMGEGLFVGGGHGGYAA